MNDRPSFKASEGETEQWGTEGHSLWGNKIGVWTVDRSAAQALWRGWQWYGAFQVEVTTEIKVRCGSEDGICMDCREVWAGQEQRKEGSGGSRQSDTQFQKLLKARRKVQRFLNK